MHFITFESEMQNSIKSFLRLIRWKNLAIIAATQYMVKFFLVDHRIFLADWRFHLLVFTTVLIAAGGYIINDYFDVKIDRINKPDKVWIGKHLSRRNALLYHQILSGLGVLLGFFVNWKIFVINAICVCLLWFYASGFKKKPFIGNLTVAFLTSLVIIEIALVYAPQNKLVYMYAIFAFFINLIREIAKDMEDIEGDQMHGAKTVPIIYGIHKAKQLLYFLMVIFLISLAFFLLKIQDTGVLIFSVFLISLWAVLLLSIFRADRKKHYANISSLSKWIILVGLLSTIFL